MFKEDKATLMHLPDYLEPPHKVPCREYCYNVANSLHDNYFDAVVRAAEEAPIDVKVKNEKNTSLFKLLRRFVLFS